MLGITRVLGLAAAAAVSVYLLWNSDRIGGCKALGLSLLSSWCSGRWSSPGTSRGG